MESSFPNFFETFYLLFWDLFGYGEIQTTAIFLPNLRFPKNSSEAEDRFLDPEYMLTFRFNFEQTFMRENSTPFVSRAFIVQ